MEDIPIHPGYAPAPSLDAVVSLPPPPPDNAAPPLLSTSAPTTSTAGAESVKMKSCAVCRLRRVKCERDPGERDCLKCKERGLECREAPTKEKGRFREGKRVKMAKEMYGSKDNPTPQVTDPSPPSSVATPAAFQSLASPSFSAYSAASAPASFASTISYSSANTRLGTIELKSSVMSSFLESFFRFKSITTFDGDINFQLTFDQAGRRVDQLTPSNQVLCSALLALGARCSDHPFLVGPSSPRLVDLTTATLQDVDLRPFGKLRGQAVEELTSQAVRLADELGVVRMGTPESVAAMMLLEGLMKIDQTGPESVGFADAYKGQIRQLLSASATDKSKRTIEGTVLSWTAYVRDAITSAYTGLSPTFSTEEAWLLRGQEDPPPPLQTQLLLPLTNIPEADYWTLLNSFVHHLTELARETPGRLSGVRARKAMRVDGEFVRDFVRRAEIALGAVPEMLKRAERMSTSPKVVTDALSLVRTLRLSTCHLSLLLHLRLQDRLSHRPASLVPLGSSQPNEEYWGVLSELAREADGLVYKAAREIVAILADALSAGMPLGTHGWVDARSCEFLFTRMPVWVGALLRGPPGAPAELSGYQLESKISDLSWTLRAMRSAGWASDRLVQSYDWIAGELAKLEALRQQQQQYFLPPPPTKSHLPPSPVAATLPPTRLNDEFDLGALLGFSTSPPPAVPTSSALPSLLDPLAFPDAPPPAATVDLDSLILLNAAADAPAIATAASNPLPFFFSESSSTFTSAPTTASSAGSPTTASSTSSSSSASASLAAGLQHDFPDLVAQFPDLF